MILKSSFSDGERLPDKCCNFGTRGGLNISPLFQWEDAPSGTKSFALTMIDNHPVANHFVHWVVIDIPAEVTHIEERASLTERMPSGSFELHTSYDKRGYGGARPPTGTGDHEYETTLYALGVETLGQESGSDITQFKAAISGKVLAKATLLGLYSQ